MATISEIDIKDFLKVLRKEGWSTRTTFADVAEYGDRFFANFKHINIRGGYGSKYLQSPTGWSSVDLWTMDIYVRNGNGGYEKVGEFTTLEGAKEHALKCLEKPEPAIPTWKRDGLPEPFEFIDANKVYYNIHPYDTGVNLRFQRLVANVNAVGIVAIESNCQVSVDATIVPDNKAWVLLECSGTCGSFKLISDGSCYYPIRKMSGDKYKISLMHQDTDYIESGNDSNGVYRKRTPNLSLMSSYDIQAIKIAVNQYIQWYAKQHS